MVDGVSNSFKDDNEDNSMARCKGYPVGKSSAGNAAYPPLMLLKDKDQSASKAQTILGGKSLIKIKTGQEKRG